MNHVKLPLVSVIITTYHNETYLPRAIESVLHQSYKEIELIVVDDNMPGSEARIATETVMQHYPQAVYLKHPENRNGAAARNTGIRAAKGKYIAFLDNDDFYFSMHISECVEALENCPEYGCVLCDVIKICDGICWDKIKVPHGDLLETLLFSETALGTGSNLFVRADLVRELNGFDESFTRHQDVEFGLRLFLKTKAYRLPEVQIIKEMEGYSNAPDFDKFLGTKKHLWSKFEDLINTLTGEEQKRYYAGQYSSLLYVACKGKNQSQIEWAILQLEQYRKLSSKERVLVKLSRHHLFECYEFLKRIVKHMKAGKLYKAVVMKLNTYDKAVLEEALSRQKKG